MSESRPDAEVTLGDTQEWLDSVRHDLRKAIAELSASYLDDYSDRFRRRFKAEIVQTIELLDMLAQRVDPTQRPTAVFDPSNPSTIGRMIALCMVNRAPLCLPLLEGNPFYGGGVYALYYKGSHPAYSKISGRPIPIYVGSAKPKSSQARTPEEQGDRLWRRLCKDHLKSIRLADGIEQEDFECRYLVTLSGYQLAAESFLISTFKPVWNSEMKVCYGFGKHGDSSSTRSNTRSPWDTLHPGRKWALDKGNKPNERSDVEIIADIHAHYESNSPEEMEAHLSDFKDILS